MKLLISGHRKYKLINYDLEWIYDTILDIIIHEDDKIIGLSGMADGIDLMFCEILLECGHGYHCYIPFEAQSDYMSQDDQTLRKTLIANAWSTFKARNSQMVEDADHGIIVWDGNKGGTHNIFQQMIENKKHFWWIEPINQKTIYF